MKNYHQQLWREIEAMSEIIIEKLYLSRGYIAVGERFGDEADGNLSIDQY